VHGHIQKRGDRYVVIIELPRDGRGKRVRHCYATKGGKRDAERELIRRLRELDTGTYAAPTKQTLAEFLNEWLETVARMRASAQSLEEYRCWCRSRIIPSLGHHRLDSLTTAHIQRAWAAMLKEVSAATVIMCHRILRSALETAVKQGLLPRNPCQAVELPRRPRREMTTLPPEQFATLIEAARGQRLFMPILLAMGTGMRRGEILALRWQDVSLDHARLVVRRATEVTKEHGLRFKEPKSGKDRVIDLPRLLVEELTRHKAEQAAQRLRVGPCWEANDLVICHEDGRPWQPDVLTAWFRDFIRTLALPHIRFHDLRHAHATSLLASGVNVKVVSERLGHSTTKMTLDVYSHALPTLQREAADRIDEAMRGTG
jgi:integrase